MSVLIRHVSGRLTSVISIIALLVFLPLFLLVIGQTVTLFSRATGTPANIVVDTKTPAGPVNTDFLSRVCPGRRRIRGYAFLRTK